MNTTEKKKTTEEILYDAVNCLGGAVWDLKIIENTIGTALENELIVIPDIDNDPLRLVLLALRAVRTDLEKQEDTLWVRMRDEKEKEEEQTTEN